MVNSMSGVGGDGNEGNFLNPGSIRPTGLQAQRGELLGEVLDGQLLTPGGGGPAAELVRGQDLGVLPDLLLCDAGQGLFDDPVRGEVHHHFTAESASPALGGKLKELPGRPRPRR